MTETTVATSRPKKSLLTTEGRAALPFRRRVGAAFAVIIALHLIGLGLLTVGVAAGSAGAVTVGVASIAYLRGLIHSFDFDHISMIDNSTRKFVAEGRNPASVGLALLWWLVGLALVLWRLGSAPDWAAFADGFGPTVAVLVVGFAAQLLSGALSYLVPSVLGGGKTVVRAKDRAGFVVNALLIPYLLSAVRMFEAGHATAEDIDNGMVLGCAHPMGPLRLLDLVGLDTTKFAAESMYAEYGEPHYAPPALLSRMVEAGLLGRKTGRGFRDYRR